jgi:hypothetical protein
VGSPFNSPSQAALTCLEELLGPVVLKIRADALTAAVLGDGFLISSKMIVIAEILPGVASLAFGQSRFDHHSIYATSTRTGNISSIPVGVGGAPLCR